LLLFAVDTAVAGFGPLTLAATAAFAVGSWAFYDAEVLALPWWLIAATTVAAFAFFVFVMTSILRAQAGPEGVSVDDLVGRPGIVRSVLNPEGHVYIDGALWRAGGPGTPAAPRSGRRCGSTRSTGRSSWSSRSMPARGRGRGAAGRGATGSGVGTRRRGRRGEPTSRGADLRAVASERARGQRARRG
jgi:membrane protein implicated in regulation of membrane protease activity